MGVGGRLREIPKGKNGKADCAAAFNNEKVAPVGERSRLDLEDAESKEARKGGGDALGGIE